MQLQLINSCIFSKLTLNTAEGILQWGGDSLVGYSPNKQKAEVSTPRNAKEKSSGFWTF